MTSAEVVDVDQQGLVQQMEMVCTVHVVDPDADNCLISVTRDLDVDNCLVSVSRDLYVDNCLMSVTRDLDVTCPTRSGP
jgi:hypothetical protein